MSFSSILPSSLTQWVDDLNTLILDIRPHAAYSSARIPHAISLSVPSTLLKRPLFSLQRLAAMLPSASARTRFLAWPSASRILVYDADSQVAGESSNINGLLRKFRLDGFQGELAWLQGGFQAIWRDGREIIDTRPPTPDPENEDDADVHDKSSQSSLLRTRRLPISAFSLTSTTIHNSLNFTSASANFIQRPTTEVSQHSLSNPPTSNAYPAYNPFFDTIRQNTELSHGITERIPLRLPRRVRRRIRDLPFPWLQNIARWAASTPSHHRSFSESSSESSSEDYESSTADVEEGKEALAMQFFKIELAEQRRLMGIMEHHSKESGQSGQLPPQGSPFPFSITAGIEKGAKNRYRHVWPFEHARVRLHQKREADDDYVNASYIQPLVTNKRYIATQGPLPATFTDFWTLCWEQNVHVIVMLTREVEGAMVKCGAYWTDTVFGPLRLRLISTEGFETPPADQRPATAGFFTQLPVPSSHSPQQFPLSAGSKRCHRPQHYTINPCETVKRVFELTHTEYPDAEPRKIVQLQYLEWPDMNVPDDPRGLLGFIKQVEDAVSETRSARDLSRMGNRDQIITNEVDQCTGIAKHALGNSPVLLHCSAGVGRTGGFIAVDSILDAMRREIRAERKPDNMDVDSSDQPPRISSSATFQLKTPIPSNNDIDIPYAPPMSTTMSDTVLWAQNVRAETDVVAGSQQNLQHNNHPAFQALKPTFILSSESQNRRRSSQTSDLYGSYHLSLTSPDHRTEGQRTMQPFSPLPISGSMFDLETPSLSSSRLLEPSPLTEPSSNTQGLNQGLSSDGEPPSKSQSPSADEANSSQAPPPIHPNLVSSLRLVPTSTSFSRENEQVMKSFDYKEPRSLHKDITPPGLTTFEDPIWEVVQDMREQRMSLCQTLRQYVFVHAAVIEGALMVLDDEKMIMNGLAMPMPRRSSPPVPISGVRPPPSISSSSHRSCSPSASFLRPVLQLHPSDTASLTSNKRGASPTELLKEDKAGEVMLSKRPSTKRKQTKEDDIIANARYRTVTPLRVTGTMHPAGASAVSTTSMPP
ncbi:phosphatases II [Phlegmacium glaucopus]|nr:phosphatases II [Phlegmacium glaucopus]